MVARTMNSRKIALQIVLMIIFCLLTMTGCQQPETGEDLPGERPMETDMNESSPARLTLEEAVDAAREDFQQRHGTTHDSVELVEARPVTWGDGSLGCPEEGMMYTQALVDGYYIRLRAGEMTAHYHAGRDGRPMHCPAERSLKPPPRSGQAM